MRDWSAQGAKVPRDSPKMEPGKNKHGGDQRTGPATTEISEFGNGLGEKHLIGVALKIAQDRGAEDGGDQMIKPKSGDLDEVNALA